MMSTKQNSKRPVIVCFDLGTNTGWAVSNENGHVISGTSDFHVKRFEGGGMRFLRFDQWLSEMKGVIGNIDEVYFEEVRRHLGTAAAHVYGGFMGVLMAWCEQHSIPYQGVPVKTIKKFITGKGNANKHDVINAVIQLGNTPEDDNEADALALLHYVRQQYYNADDRQMELL